MDSISLDIEQLKALAELLIGAAYADDDYDGHEAESIGDILRSLVPDGELPMEITGHLAMFDIDTFALGDACTRLGLQDATERRAILRLISEVTHADDVLDLAESEYIKRAGEALGASPEEYEDLTFDLVAIAVTPPPVPGA